MQIKFLGEFLLVAIMLSGAFVVAISSEKLWIAAIFFLIGVVAAFFTIHNCAKESREPERGVHLAVNIAGVTYSGFTSFKELRKRGSSELNFPSKKGSDEVMDKVIFWIGESPQGRTKE